MNNWSNCSSVERDPLKVSGAWLFRGTRVPVSALFENLEDGAQLDDFVAWFPGRHFGAGTRCSGACGKEFEGSLMRVLFDQGTPVGRA